MATTITRRLVKTGSTANFKGRYGITDEMTEEATEAGLALKDIKGLVGSVYVREDMGAEVFVTVSSTPPEGWEDPFDVDGESEVTIDDIKGMKKSDLLRFIEEEGIEIKGARRMAVTKLRKAVVTAVEATDDDEDEE